MTPFAISAAGKKIHKTCSIGYVSFPFYDKQPDLLNFEKTIMLADMGLLYAKKNGRNKAVFVKATEIIPQADQTDDLISSLEYSLKNNLITLSCETKDKA
jgi:predicted signal transduction protein with EAL and GGDEF domain